MEPDATYVPPPTVFNFPVGQVPDTWKTMQEQFIALVASNVRCIAADTHIAPFAHFSDGSLDLVVVHSAGM